MVALVLCSVELVISWHLVFLCRSEESPGQEASSLGTNDSSVSLVTFVQSALLCIFLHYPLLEKVVTIF
jgi:hypothetical protein